MSPRAVIFDFDGTLVRSHSAVFTVIERLTRRRRRGPMMTPEQFRELGTREMLHQLNVRAWQIPWFTFRARRALRPLMSTVEFEPGLIEVLRAAHASGIKLAVVSSNAPINVETLLQRAGVEHLFDVVLSGAGLFGKRRILARAVKRLGVTSKEILTVGDETRDVIAARSAGLPCAAVGWGFHSPERLKLEQPDFLVTSPAELARVITADFKSGA